jgi:hypothetical protein
MVLKLCDELDKAPDLHDYFQRKMESYISDIIIPQFRQKKGMDLLQNYVKQWKNFTILVHFLRKMLNYLVRLYSRFIYNRTATTSRTTTSPPWP